MKSTSLEVTIEHLDGVLADARVGESYLGVFPAMYRSVTAAVLEAVRAGGFFDDDERIEQLTITFAGLYLQAVHSYREGAPVVASWMEAFEIAEAKRKRMILQHLLLGMNAHINLDLGIATAEAGADQLPSMWADFIRVNEILFQILDRLQAGLGEVSPRIALLDRLGGPLDEGFMRLGIRTARDMAWHFAHHLDAQGSGPAARREAYIAQRDRDVARLGRTIIRPWSPVDVVGRLVALSEIRDIGVIIDALSDQEVDLDQAARDSESCIEKPPKPERPLVGHRAARA